MTTRFGRDRLVASGVACFALVLVPAALAQDGREDPRDVGSSRTAMFDRSDLGNVAQAARFAYGSGERELKRAESLEAKLGKLEGKKLETTQKKIATAYENAQGSFREALGLAPKMVEAYVGLGRVLRATRKYRESLQVVVQGLRLDSANDALFTGWAESILGLDMLGTLRRHMRSSWRRTRPGRSC
ncbi:MAG: hypothetical protein O7A98_08800 [Acidobacteria bacterium]|nr:hypothetical protein [Acidobacteriota bacterium]